ncbi:hypothetical protein [Streptomyces sp. NPDC008121]|uniref:hypothetical protein n=1 Tax=Streptomyces sp. NPDC008121 TaxID=3364809 RepID=UPI0036F0AC7C
MPARTHPSTRSTSHGVDTRLPWWALALPVAAFLALFALIAGPGKAHAVGSDPAVGHVLRQIQQTLSL